MIGNKMKTILITGINGFLGSHLAKRLSENNNIVGLEYEPENLFRLTGYDFEVFNSSNESIRNIFEKREVDFIIHTATFYGRGNEDILQLAETNLFMPFRLLNLAIKNNVAAFINTDTVLDRFVSAYALTKNQFREWLHFRRNEIKTINMQLDHFYGEGCSNSNFVTSMIDRLKSNDPVIDLTAGEQQRDFIYYEDVVNAFEIVVKKNDEIATGSNFQVGSGEYISIKKLMLFLKKKIGSSSYLNFGAIPYRENELMKSDTNIELLKNLGWRPKYGIKEGLSKLL